jgi:hypothetical protein
MLNSKRDGTKFLITSHNSADGDEFIIGKYKNQAQMAKKVQRERSVRFRPKFLLIESIFSPQRAINHTQNNGPFSTAS